ncbi:hypothetical protein JKX24_22840 [Serratia proteamaculans]|uniref:DUF5625 domain-containing protein n=1 Tax=Serratia proteamaculans TaxID=28151 RepID=A0A7U0RN21_SERPR|nr:DUF5625 family protein [Serratia proteamaculans]MBO1501782.1 hypothetical protein [Serratia proteamaculans]MDW5508632.1 DUF5625 family protein [Serratia proteamaculans]QQX52967.1 hypothetical protein JKX24_22840 [Serratia proteamaculans]
MDYRRLLILLCCIGLVACNEPVVQYKRIYVSQIGQSVEFQFDVKKTGDYQFALLFSASEEKENSEERKLQINLFGDEQNEGEKIPISLRLVKDGKLFSEEVIDSSGTIGRDKFYRGYETNTVLVRNIKIIDLPPGHYSATIGVISDTPDFDYVSTFAMMLDVSPKNLAQVSKQNKATAERLNSEWHTDWRFAKWLAQGVYCIAFCGDSLYIFQPIDISQSRQSVKIDFKVNKEGRYQFALMFDKNTENHEEMFRRLKLFGGFNNKGVVISVSFKLLRNGRIFYNRKINSARSNGSRSVHVEERSIYSSERVVRILELSPGHYSVTITTLGNTPEFIGIESFFSVTAVY